MTKEKYLELKEIFDNRNRDWNVGELFLDYNINNEDELYFIGFVLLKDQMITDERIRFEFARLQREYSYFEEIVIGLTEKYTKEQLLATLLFSDGRYFGKRKRLEYLYNALIHEILKPSRGDSLIHLFGYYDHYLDNLGFQFLGKVYGIVANEIYPLTKIKKQITDLDVSIMNMNDYEPEKITANKVFSFCYRMPRNIRQKRVKYEEAKPADLWDMHGFELNLILTDFQDQAKEKGIYVFMTRTLANLRGRDARKELIDQGLVEGIIEVDNRTFGIIGDTYTFLIISRGNESVKMVDGVTLAKDHDYTVEEMVEKILAIYNQPSDYSKIVSKGEIEENDYALTPRRYIIQKDEKLKNYYELGEVAEITRGYSNVEIKDFKERETEENTRFKYLEVKDVQDDLYISDLTNLTEIKENELKYCIEYGDIVLPRMGLKKPMVLTDGSHTGYHKDDLKILVSGSLYIIRADKEKIDPYYLNLYLSSAHAEEQRSRLVTGTRIPLLTTGELAKIKIPKIDLKLQKEIGMQYKSLLYKDVMIREIKEQNQQNKDRLLEKMFEEANRD